jgi:hypothetical protein
MIVNEIVRWAEENKEESIFLHASPDGRQLYEQLGFTPTNEMRRPLNGRNVALPSV